MQRTSLFAVLALSAAAAGAQQGFVDHARVRNVEPQYEQVQVPREECSSQWVTETRPVAGGQNYGGAVIGGVTGAIVGNQVGKGHGREAATAVGAVIGAFAGDRIANRDNYPRYEEAQREVRTCRTVMDVQNRITGYRVQYDYQGRGYTTVMRDHPGSTLPVQVSVVPMERGEFRR